ncbi:MAG: hypothetical protein C3F06_11625 [Candidatus Methanoperedenaceae archaeon]|nr:MAG: hypothetical protein C3F06_11625 [Candidatus Methanoperedenaceae archaeon]
MNNVINKTVAVAFLLAIAIMTGSLIAAAGGTDLGISRAQINPMKGSGTSLTSSGAITFSGNVVLLWSKSLPGGLIYISKTDDMDGDKKGDIILEVDNESTGVDIHTAIAVKGSDGTDLWRESTDIDVDEFSVIPTGDLNGDKKADVIFVNGSTLIAKKGIDYTNLWQESVIHPSVISAIPTDDLNGDKKADVLVIKGNWATGAYSVEAKKGKDGINLWQESFTGEGGISATPTGDLNGDKKADVLVTIDDSYANNHTLIAKKGKDGTNLWQESFTREGGISVIPTNDLNGDKKADVFVVIGNTLIAKKGKDGTNLWQESVTENGLMDVIPTNDLNGDKKADVLVKIDDWNANNHTVMAKKGNHGTNLWQISVTGINLGIFAEPSGDLNGDKKADVLVTILNTTRFANNITIMAKKGYDGTNLWQKSNIGWARPTDDLNGDKKADVLLLGSTIIAKKGSDFTDLWKASSTGDIGAMPIGDLDRDGRENTLVTSYDNIYAIGIPK